jgi:hypothetical protein
LPFEQRLQVEVSARVGITEVPLDPVENAFLHPVLNSLVDLGRSQPRVHIGSEGWKLTRARSRSTMVEESKKIDKAVIGKFAEMPCVSLAIDAGTMGRRCFLDIIVLAPYARIKPFLDDVVERAALNAEDYGTIVMAAIKELSQKRVNVRLIVGDNVRAQVTALTHWSSRYVYNMRRNQIFMGLTIPRMCAISSSELWVIPS